MTRRSLPLFALLCLSLAAPVLAFGADKADSKKKAATKKPPDKKAEAEPEDAAFQEFIDNGAPPASSSSASTPPTASTPSTSSTAQPPEPSRTETRQLEAVNVDASPPPEEEKPSKPAAASAPSSGPFGPVVGHAGGYITFSFGYNWWSLNRAMLNEQVFPADDPSFMLDASLQNGAAAGLRGGYNVLGHAHVGFNFLATGWDVFDQDRGGGGYIGGEVGWHPLSLVSALLARAGKGALPGEKYYDLFIEGGAGWGIVGEDRAMQGPIGSVGVGVEGVPATWVSIGVRSTWYYPLFSEYILDYNHRRDPGNTINLPKGSGGSFCSVQGYLAFHFGTPEK